MPEPTQQAPVDAKPDNVYAPFEDRLAFEWADQHYVKLQASSRAIGCGLDLWGAALAKGGFGGDTPWRNTEEMYETIDSICAGDAPWTTYTFQYNGPKPNGTVPKWMEQTY